MGKQAKSNQVKSTRAHFDTAAMRDYKTERTTPDRASLSPSDTPSPDRESGAPVVVSRYAQGIENSTPAFDVGAAKS
jgi:hypothetical protein